MVVFPFFHLQDKCRLCVYVCVLVVCVCASPQSCDGSEYTLQGTADGNDITGLSAEPAHYQLLSELGEKDSGHVLKLPPVSAKSS